jgi:predicted transcriptional regulator
MKSILPLLDVFKKLADMGVAHILTHHDAVLKQSVEGLDGVILDKDLLETVKRCKGYRC